MSLASSTASAPFKSPRTTVINLENAVIDAYTSDLAESVVYVSTFLINKRYLLKI